MRLPHTARGFTRSRPGIEVKVTTGPDTLAPAHRGLTRCQWRALLAVGAIDQRRGSAATDLHLQRGPLDDENPRGERHGQGSPGPGDAPAPHGPDRPEGRHPVLHLPARQGAAAAVLVAQREGTPEHPQPREAGPARGADGDGATE